MKEKVKIKKNSANLFKDSGLSNPEEFMKARFVSIIRDVLVERGLGPDEAVKTLEISKSELAVLQEGKCADFSLDCLLLLLEKLGLYIEFVPHEIPAGATSKGFRISTSLHCFQKKSKFGIKTPKREIDLIRRRLNRAQEHALQENENE